MNETLRQFTAKLALDLKGKLSSSETADFIKQVKASGDDRTFEVVMSTSDEDRQGDELDQSKWDFKYFDMNPVVLWAHDYQSFPIGVVEDIRIEGDKAIATGKFAQAGVNPEADMACALYQEKILRTVSPGYIQNDDGTRELLEMSFCPVPAGRYALSLRQVGRLGVSTCDLVTKGFFYEEKKEKSPQVGDSCELEDGSPGVLAESEGDPGKLVCVPREEKETKSNEPMNELEKKLKAEHERHGEEVGKAIDEFEEKCTKEEKSEESEKAIDEFKDAIGTEQAMHLEKSMKAIDDEYETFGREENKPEKTHAKSIDEFKSDMTDEHLKHVKATDKAIDEFKGEFPHDGETEEKRKAIDEFTKTMDGELDRHEEAHKELCEKEADRMGEGESEDKSFELISEAVKSVLAEEGGSLDQLSERLVKAIALKAGRAISAATKEKLKAIIKAIEDHHEEHGKSTDEITAALKSLVDAGGGGEEPKPGEKSGAAPKPRSSPSGAKADLEVYLFNQRLVRQVKTAAEEVLRQINPKIKELTTRGR
jgi:hypothetical protein